MEKIVMIIIAAIGIFLLFREIGCWYFKINVRMQIAKDTLDALQKISVHLDGIEEKISARCSRHDDEKVPAIGE